MAVRLPTASMLAQVADDPRAPVPGDLTHPSMRTWLEGLPAEVPAPYGSRYEAAFETALHWSPGGAKGAIDKALKQAGYRRAAPPMRFFVEGSYGPLRDGEIERARAWGEALARAAGRVPVPA
jgi:hypothetical protein